VQAERRRLARVAMEERIKRAKVAANEVKGHNRCTRIASLPLVARS